MPGTRRYLPDTPSPGRIFAGLALTYPPWHALAARRLSTGALALALVTGVPGTFSPSGDALAFEALNPAQTLIYDRPHLADTRAGDTIVYRYRARTGDADEVLDEATLVVDGESGEERRDVSLDFLHDERHMELPPFEGYRGNPVLIAMLEHVAQSVAATAGGGALYVRNRLRDGLARDGATILRDRRRHAGADIDTVSLAFRPFVNDPALGALAGVGGATVEIVFSDDVPGGVLEISARSAADKERATGGAVTGTATDDTPPFAYELRLDDHPDDKP